VASATYYITAEGNDGDKDIGGGGAWSYTGTDLQFGSDSSGDAHTIGLRFVSVAIAAGSTITAATLTGHLAGFGVPDGTLRTRVYGIDEDNTAILTSDPTGRTKTTANVNWDEASKTDPIVSPSLVSIVQEIVDRGGWSSGNAMGFLILDDSSDADPASSYESYEGDSSSTFALAITWTLPASSTSSTTTSTSTSTTSSTSSSTSSTTTQWPDPNYAQGIMRITKEGRDVINSNYLDDFFFDSDYPLLKVHDYGSFTTGITGLKEIAHTLGYIPYAMVFSQYLENDGGGGVTITDEYYQHDWFLRGASYYSYGYTKIYDDKLDIVIENINTPTPGTINGFYYIFVEEVI